MKSLLLCRCRLNLGSQIRLSERKSGEVCAIVVRAVCFTVAMIDGAVHA